MSTMNLDVTFIRPRRVSVWNQLKQSFGEWRRRARSRRELMYLGESDLNDLGISRCDVQSEASKPFWQA